MDLGYFRQKGIRPTYFREQRMGPKNISNNALAGEVLKVLRKMENLYERRRSNLDEAL